MSTHRPVVTAQLRFWDARISLPCGFSRSTSHPLTLNPTALHWHSHSRRDCQYHGLGCHLPLQRTSNLFDLTSEWIRTTHGTPATRSPHPSWRASAVGCFVRPQPTYPTLSLPQPVPATHDRSDPCESFVSTRSRIWEFRKKMDITVIFRCKITQVTFQRDKKELGHSFRLRTLLPCPSSPIPHLDEIRPDMSYNFSNLSYKICRSIVFPRCK